MVKLQDNEASQRDCSDPTFLDDYLVLTSLYDLHVVEIKNKGKGVVAKCPLSAGVDILEELPLAVWPIKSPSGIIEDIFCENCLHFLPYEGSSACLVTDKVAPPFPLSQMPHNCGNSNCPDFLSLFCNQCDTVSGSSEEAIAPRSESHVEPDTYFCCDACAIQSLGSKSAVCSRNDISTLDSCFQNNHSFANEDPGDSSKSSVGGWLKFLSTDGLRTLRKCQREVDPLGDYPITLEAFGRIISRIVAITVQLNTEFHLPLNEAYTVAWRSYERLFPTQSLSLIDFDFDFERTHNILSVVLGDKIESAMGESIRTHLLSLDILQQIMMKLMLNSQSLNIWGTSRNGELTVLKAAGVYLLQSCFNHSCDPNCTVSCMWDSTITITTLRSIAEGEELSLSYIPTDLSLDERKNLLLNYLFYCSCSKCSFEEKQAAAADK